MKKVRIVMTRTVGEAPSDLDLMPKRAGSWSAQNRKNMGVFYKFVRMAVDYAEKTGPKDSEAVRYLMGFFEPMYDLATNLEKHPGGTLRDFIVMRLRNDAPLCNNVLAFVGEPPMAEGEIPRSLESYR